MGRDLTFPIGVEEGQVAQTDRAIWRLPGAARRHARRTRQAKASGTHVPGRHPQDGAFTGGKRGLVRDAGRRFGGLHRGVRESGTSYDVAEQEPEPGQ
jgi:hypothetical protein